MSTIVLSQSEVRHLLPMDTCIRLMGEAFKALGRGNAVNPLRRGLVLPGNKGLLGMMPGYLGEPEAMGLKVVSVFPGNHGTDYDSHQGIVVLFEMDHGQPVAIMDASEVTAIRTAAATAVATRLLARANATTLAILGSGVQARTHLEAMTHVRTISAVRVFSPNEHNRRTFAADNAERFGISVEPVDDARTAVAGADIVCTCTSSSEPVVLGEWLEPGMHINAVGSSISRARELDTEAVARARLFVDRTESTVNEAGDYLFAVRDGAIDESHIVAEISDLLLGRNPGRNTDEEITLFKSLGLAVEDLAAAHHVLHAARSQKIGTAVDLGGVRS